MKKILLLLIFLSCTIQAEYKDHSFSDKLNFIADKKDELALNLFRICKFSQKTLSQSLHKLPLNAKKILLQLEGLPPGSRQSSIIYFSRQELRKMSFYEIVERINRQLLKRTLVALGAKPNHEPPSWLVAAITHQIQLGKKSVLTQERFPMTRYSVIHNKFPDMNTLVEKESPAPRSYWLYIVYAEQCFLLLEGLKREKEGKKDLVNYYSTKSNTNFLSYISQRNEKFSTYAKRKNWYEEVCHKVCFNTINPLPAKVIHKKVLKLFSIRIARPGSKSVRVALEDLSNQENNALDHIYIVYLKARFFNLLFKAPVSLRRSLGDLLQSLQFLEEKEYAKFKKAIVQAKQKFKKALEFQAQLNQYLDELEKKHNSLVSRYSHVLTAEHLAKDRRKNLFPKWQQYLNELEKKLAQVNLK